jgi:hypothetical protein
MKKVISLLLRITNKYVSKDEVGAEKKGDE